MLFIEDVAEPAYKIDRMLTQLLNIEKFRKNLAGILLGDFTSLDCEQYFNDIFYGLNINIPIASGLKIGHEKEKITLPIGLKCNFNTDPAKLCVF